MTKMSYNQQSKLLGGQIGLLKMQLSASRPLMAKLLSNLADELILSSARNLHHIADHAVQIFGGRGITVGGMGGAIESFQVGFIVVGCLDMTTAHITSCDAANVQVRRAARRCRGDSRRPWRPFRLKGHAEGGPLIVIVHHETRFLSSTTEAESQPSSGLCSLDLKGTRQHQSDFSMSLHPHRHIIGLMLSPYAVSIPFYLFFIHFCDRHWRLWNTTQFADRTPSAVESRYTRLTRSAPAALRKGLGAGRCVLTSFLRVRAARRCAGRTALIAGGPDWRLCDLHADFGRNGTPSLRAEACGPVEV